MYLNIVLFYTVNQVYKSQIITFLIIVCIFIHQDSKHFSSLAFRIMCFISICFTLSKIAWFSIIQIILINTDTDCFRSIRFNWLLTWRDVLQSNKIKYSKFYWQVQSVSQSPMLCGICTQSNRVKMHAYNNITVSLIVNLEFCPIKVIFCYSCIEHVDVLCISLLNPYGKHHKQTL